MFSMNLFCFSCLKNKNNLSSVKNSFNGVSYEEKLIYSGLFYNLPPNTEELLCSECCDEISKVYDFKKQFLEKQELLRTYVESLKVQKNSKKLKNLSQNTSNHQYIPEAKVLNVDLTDDDLKVDVLLEPKIEQVDLTLDDDNDEKVSTADITLTNPFTNTSEIVHERVEANEKLEVIIKTEEGEVDNEEKNEDHDREFINNLPQIEENYQIENGNNNGLKIVFKKSEKEKFECMFCMKIFYSEKNLKIHEKIHPKSYIPCKICNKVLSSKMSFQLHMSKHTGEYKYRCTICNKGLTTKQNLHIHKLSHMKRKKPSENLLKKRVNDQVSKRYPSRSNSETDSLSTMNTSSVNMSNVNDNVSKRYPSRSGSESDFQINVNHLSTSVNQLSNVNEVSKRYPSRSGSESDFQTTVNHLSTSVNLSAINDQLSKRYPSRSGSEIDTPVNQVSTDSEASTVKVVNIPRKRGRPRKNPVEHMCKLCNQKFVCKQALTKHNFRFHTEHNCTNCDKTFNSKTEMSQHRRSCQIDTKNIYCEKCDSYFSNFANYNDHVERAHKEHKCQKCSMTFQNKMMLIHHKKRMCQTSNFKCEFCEKSFKLSIQLKQHLKCHVDDLEEFGDENNSEFINTDTSVNTDFKCQLCDRVFMNKLKFDSHMMIHSGVFNFQCKFCPNMFTTKDSLQSHINRVHKHKFYHCNPCVKSFKTYVYYKKHIQQVHLKVIPRYNCDFCTKTFPSFRQLRNHKNKHSSDEKIYQCPECDHVFFQKSGMIRHLVTHTQERNHVCKYCGRKFNLGAILIRHIKSMHEDDEEFDKTIE